MRLGGLKTGMLAQVGGRAQSVQGVRLTPISGLSCVQMCSEVARVRLVPHLCIPKTANHLDHVFRRSQSATWFEYRLDWPIISVSGSGIRSLAVLWAECKFLNGR